jgi:hypothetical protein
LGGPFFERLLRRSSTTFVRRNGFVELKHSYQYPLSAVSA